MVRVRVKRAGFTHIHENIKCYRCETKFLRAQGGLRKGTVQGHPGEGQRHFIG